jgi:hypothetical protein
LRSIEDYLLKNAKFIFLSLVILFAIAISLVFAISWLNRDSAFPMGSYQQPMEEISIDWGSYDSKENAIFVNCTLTKGYNGATECNLTYFTLGYTTKIQNLRGSIFEGIPIPSKLLLNETTTVRLNLGTPLPPEIYSIDLRTNYGFSSCTLNVGNFTDPQKQIEVKKVLYTIPDKAVFVECNRIEARTDLFVVIRDIQGDMVANDHSPIRTQTAEGTIIQVGLNNALTSGQYTLYLVAEKGLISNFTVP